MNENGDQIHLYNTKTHRHTPWAVNHDNLKHKCTWSAPAIMLFTRGIISLLRTTLYPKKSFAWDNAIIMAEAVVKPEITEWLMKRRSHPSLDIMKSNIKTFLYWELHKRIKIAMQVKEMYSNSNENENSRLQSIDLMVHQWCNKFGGQFVSSYSRNDLQNGTNNVRTLAEWYMMITEKPFFANLSMNQLILCLNLEKLWSSIVISATLNEEFK